MFFSCHPLLQVDATQKVHVSYFFTFQHNRPSHKSLLDGHLIGSQAIPIIFALLFCLIALELPVLMRWRGRNNNNKKTQEAARSGKQGAHKRGEQMFSRCGLRLQEGPSSWLGYTLAALFAPSSSTALFLSQAMLLSLHRWPLKSGHDAGSKELQSIFLPVLEQECVGNPPSPSLFKSSTLLMSRVLVLLGPQGQRPYTFPELATFQQNHPLEQVLGHWNLVAETPSCLHVSG